MFQNQNDNVLATLTHATPTTNTNAYQHNASSPHAISLATLDHGHIISTQFQHQGLTLSATNASPAANLLVAFDSNSRQTSNPRIEGPNASDRKKWIGGNIHPNQNLGTLLIIQEHGYDADSTISTWPEAQPSNPAGHITLKFDTPANAFGFDILGCEGPESSTLPNAPGLDSGFKIQLYDANNQPLAPIGFSEFLNPNSPYYNTESPLQFGQRSANRIKPITAESLNTSAFTQVDIHLGGPAALGSLIVKTDTPTPTNFKFPG